MIGRALCAMVLACALAAPRTAHAYEFWVRAQTIGQAYQLRDYRLVGPDLFLDRRRYTQTLALRVWDVGDLAANRRKQRLPEQGLRISFQTYLRVDHDFGDYSGGRIRLPGTVPVDRDALDVIPELGESIAALDVMYGYLQLDGLADDRLTVQIGRILADDGWGTTAIDGATARFELPAPVAMTVSAGLRVRAASPLGTAQYELDGTSGAGCQEYVEGATPGTGQWKLIDRQRNVTNTRLASDYEYCPQREQWQPTVGFTLATSRVHGFGAEMGYRRTSSDTVGLIGDVNRFDNPDKGLYPNEFGQAPGEGIDEERLWARIHGDFKIGTTSISPYLDTRWSLLHDLVDRADAGVKLRSGDHQLEPSVEYFYPTFDGDSIFNAFAIEPTLDARLAYQYAPAGGSTRATASGWVRKYLHDLADPDAGGAYAGGVDGGVERAFGRRWKGRVDALWDDGFGGRRVGGGADVAWRPATMVWVGGRAVVLGVAPDDGKPRYVTASTTISTTWKMADAVALHAVAEADDDAIHDLQLRAIVILDLAFEPEP